MLAQVRVLCAPLLFSSTFQTPQNVATVLTVFCRRYDAVVSQLRTGLFHQIGASEKRGGTLEWAVTNPAGQSEGSTSPFCTGNSPIATVYRRQLESPRAQSIKDETSSSQTPKLHLLICLCPAWSRCPVVPTVHPRSIHFGDLSPPRMQVGAGAAIGSLRPAGVSRQLTSLGDVWRRPPRGHTQRLNCEPSPLP